MSERSNHVPGGAATQYDVAHGNQTPGVKSQKVLDKPTTPIKYGE